MYKNSEIKTIKEGILQPVPNKAINDLIFNNTMEYSTILVDQYAKCVLSQYSKGCSQ